MTDKHICETCGQPTPQAGGIVADRGRGEVRRSGVVCYLPPHEFDLFTILLDRVGRVVSKSVLMDQLYQLADTEPEYKIVDVFVCKIRNAIRGLPGVKIKTWWGRGYSLEVELNDGTAPDTKDFEPR